MLACGIISSVGPTAIKHKEEIRSLAVQLGGVSRRVDVLFSLMKNPAVQRIREFNRFYTRVIGLL